MMGSLSQGAGQLKEVVRDSDRQVILTLQKSLEAEKLRNLNLSAELELQRSMSLSQGAGANLTAKPEDRGFYSSAPSKRFYSYVISFLFITFNLLNCILSLKRYTID